MGSKQDVIEDVFKVCKSKNNYVFDNVLVKTFSRKHKFGNPFDATKFDDTSRLPEILLKNNFFIIHLGGGKHKFIKGIENGYHKFESIKSADVHDWKYQKSILNELDTSESNVLSIAVNQRIIHDFLYEDIVASPKVYNPRRVKTSLEYYISKELIEARNLQIEIDLTMELNKVVTVFEGKNGLPIDFAIYQLYHPFKYYSQIEDINKIGIGKIDCCYIVRNKQNDVSVLRLYDYIFENKNDMCSIKLVKCAQYNLVKR